MYLHINRDHIPRYKIYYYKTNKINLGMMFQLLFLP